METNYDFVIKKRLQGHKIKPTQFVSVAGGIEQRLNKTIQYRKSCRLTGFDAGRNISQDECPTPVTLTQKQLAQERRKQQLQKWKEDSERKKREAAKSKKKPFVVGIHHAPLRYMPPPPIVKAKPSTSGRVTRSTTRRAEEPAPEPEPSFAPRNATFRPPTNISLQPSLQNKKTKNMNLTFNPIPPNTLKDASAETSYRMTRSRSTTATTSNSAGKKVSPKKQGKRTPKIHAQSNRESIDVGYSGSSSDYSPVILERKSTSKEQNFLKVPIESPILQSTKTPKRSSVKVPITVTPKSNIPRSESSSEERLRSPKEMVTETPKEVEAKPPEWDLEEYRRISPRVTVSRGKSNIREEMKIKLREGLLQDDDSDLEDATHFRRQLDLEVARISALCDTWEDHSRQTELPDLAQAEVLGAVGQARLLMSSKFQQFAGLVDKCEAHDAAQGLITPADLLGFWEMVCLQIKNVDVRFRKLDELREREWREEQPDVQKKSTRTVAGRRPRPGPSGTAAVARPSRLREMIAAARKKQEQSSSLETERSEDKTFEAGFFSVKSPVRSPTTRTPAGTNADTPARTPAGTPAGTPARTPAGTPARRSLLKNVLSNEARKASANKNSSFAILRASLIGKYVEMEGIAPLQQTPKLPPIDLNATPARSILKAAHHVEKSGKKAIKTVLFDQSIEIDSSPLEIERSPEGNVSQTDLNVIDNGAAAMVIDATIDTSQNKENSRRKQRKLVRQDEIDYSNTDSDSPMMTRNRRRSTQTPKKVETEDKPRSTRRSKNVLQEIDVNPIEVTATSEGSATSKRRSSRKKSAPENVEVEESTMATRMATRRSSRRVSKMAEDVLFSTPEEPVNTPRAVRRRGKKSDNV